jgi:polyhydroxyalkanoate synthesis regulator phasin
LKIITKNGGTKMQELTAATFEDVDRLKRRVQHLEEEVARLKMRMSGKKWL